MKQGILTKPIFISTLNQLGHKKRGLIVDVISALYILLFAYTGINKLIVIEALQFVLKDYPLIGSYSTYVSYGLPVTELAIALLLFFPRTRLIGLYFSVGLMVAFTGYLIYMLIYAPKLPCTCGGMLQAMSWTQHLIFNIVFVVIGAIAIKLLKQKVS